MKKSPAIFLLLVFMASVQLSNAAAPKAGVAAKIDGCDFKLKNNTKCTARTGGESNTTVLTFNGPDIKDKDGKLHEQQIQVEYVLTDGKPVIMGVTFEFNDQTFYSLPGASSMNVSKLEWSQDKKTLLLSANFDAKVQKPQSNENFEGIIGIQGSIENVKVSATPSDVAEITTE